MDSDVQKIVPMEAATSQATAGDRLDDLAQIIGAYNEVTEKLQNSHEALRAEVVRLQRELASTDARLQRSKRLAALGEMAAGIAHEIRNPLAAIQLYAKMLLDDLREQTERPSPPTAEDNARKIASACRGLNAIVSDVLSFAREIKPRCAEIALSDALGRAIEAHRPSIDAANVDVLRVGDHEDMVAYADAELLHQVLLNLIRNAVDAMSATGGTLLLEVRGEDHQVCVTVRDTGPGIGQQDIDRIFNPFFTTRNTGTGLGLAIVHRIIDAHGGAIGVSNDGGAAFTLSLPRPRASRQPARSSAGVAV